jgi:hypothetical protein
MPRKHRPRWIGFAVFGVLAILGLFVLHGIAAGATCLAAMIVFVLACIHALRSEDPDTVAHDDRTGLSGWFGGWF